MGSYQWKMGYHCTEETAKNLVLNFGFEEHEDEGNAYQVQVQDWNPLILRFRKPYEMEITFHWMGESTTEIYFDYLIGCGEILGQLRAAISTLPKDPEYDE